jgi:hypothetical protein
MVRTSLQEALVGEGYVVFPRRTVPRRWPWSLVSVRTSVLLDLNMPIKNFVDHFSSFSKWSRCRRRWANGAISTEATPRKTTPENKA